MTLEKQIKHINNNLFAARMENIIQYMYEDELEKQVAKVFHRMRKEILKNLKEYYNTDVMFNAHMDLILAPIHENHKKYYDKIIRYKIREHQKGQVQGRRLVKRAKQYAKAYSKNYFGAVKADSTIPMSSIIQKDKLFATSDYSAEHMRDKTFLASENTLARVDKDINKIITDGYTDGWGINDVANKIETRFDQLETWEARRIARTEIHGSHMQGIMQSYEEMGVEYTQWASAHDNRTRDTHSALDGEIIPFGGVFSNGLRYPGDTNGPIQEWINCRCGVLPWFCPPGMMVPVGMTNFRESDLVVTLDKWSNEQLITSLSQSNPTSKYKIRSSDLEFDFKIKSSKELSEFTKLKTNEDIADFFDLKYIKNGPKFNNAESFEFYDPKHNCTIRFGKSSTNRMKNIDYSNNGNSQYDLREVLKAYDEAPTILKESTEYINFLNKDDGLTCGIAHIKWKGIDMYEPSLRRTMRRGAEFEPFDFSLYHEMGHCFDARMTDIAGCDAGDLELSLGRSWHTASKNDHKFQIKKFGQSFETTIYEADDAGEDFAEMIATVACREKGMNFKIDSPYKLPDLTRASGFRRDYRTLIEVKDANPNRYTLAKKYLNQIKPEHFVSGDNVDLKNIKEFNLKPKKILSNIKGYDEFKLTAEEKIELKELQSKEKPKFLDRMRLEELEEKEMFNSLNNKYITEGKLSLEEAKDFRTLQNSMKISGIYDGELTSLEELQGIEIKPAKIAKPSPKEEIAQINRNELYDGIEFKDFTNDPDKLLDKQIEAQLKVNYSQEHISIVNNYGEEGFRDINKYLNGREDYRIDVNTLENKIKTLTEAIDISPPLQENSVLWRGGELTKELKEYVNLIEKGELSVNDIEGKSGIFKSFSSTSVDRDVALDFKEEDEERWLYKILADTNTEGLHIDDYEIFSGLAEDEILIQRGYKFDVITMDLEKQELTIILRSVEL